MKEIQKEGVLEGFADPWLINAAIKNLKTNKTKKYESLTKD